MRAASLLVLCCVALSAVTGCDGRRPPVTVEAEGTPGHTDWKIGLPF